MRVCLLLMSLCFGLAAQSAFVGSDVCKKCHPDVWANFFRNAHYRSLAMAAKAPAQAAPSPTQASKTGCEGCHGPASEHVKAPAKTNIVAFSQLNSKDTLNQCLGCHQQQIPRANIRRSAHTTADVACTNCHSIHKSPTPKFLLAREQKDLCYSCHPSVRAQFNMPVKHRVNEGFMQCTDCHNPHGVNAATWRMGNRPRMVDQSLLNEETCLKCHTQYRGPFVYEHAAVRVDGCESCHVPHGSTNARLLKRPVVFTLCLECHNGAGNFGRSGDGVQLPSSSHSMTEPRFQNCTACHIRIHGSNGDARFLR